MQHTLTLTRVQQSWLAAKERRLLLWIAAKLPDAVKPDHLTALGLFGAALCGSGFALSGTWPPTLWFVCLGLLLNWLGDSLDGNLARLRKMERPHYGFFVDHATDVVAQALIFLGLGLSPHMRLATACLLLLSYWLASLFTFIRAVATNVFQISYFGIGPTEIRLGLLVYTLGLIILGVITIGTPFGRMSPLDILAIVIFCAVFISYLCMTWSAARELAVLDRSGSAPRTIMPASVPHAPSLPDTTAGLATASH
jgi:phosphatidylglycerophosphate synthase